MSSAAALSACLDFIQTRVLASLPGKIKLEKFTRHFHEESNRLVLEEFIREPEILSCYIFYETSEKLVVTLTPAIKKKGVFLLKSKNVSDSLKLEDLKTEVIFTEITDSILQNLTLVASEVYFPLLSNPANRSGWSGPTSKEVMLKFSNFLSNCTMTLGQSRGQTLLPYPPPEAFDEDNLVEKDRIYLLETAVLQWTMKIQNVLATDPEQQVKEAQQAQSHPPPSSSSSSSSSSSDLPSSSADLPLPTPFQEIDFWVAKSSDLHSLNEQLSSDKFRFVVEILTDMKSPLANAVTTLRSGGWMISGLLQWTRPGSAESQRRGRGW
jgi:dynein heavy chain